MTFVVILLVSLPRNHDGAFSRRVLAASLQPIFTKDVVPILQKIFLICHSLGALNSGLVMYCYEALMKGGEHGPSVVPHDAAGSRLVAMLEGGAQPRMPLDDDPLPAGDIAIIKDWINAGATRTRDQ